MGTAEQVKVIGQVGGCTNPESAELLPDGETVIFGNCALTVGIEAFRGGTGLVYLAGQAFISTAHLTSQGLTMVERRLVEGLTATLGTEVITNGTALLPAGTPLIVCGGLPTTPDGTSLSKRSDAHVLAFDPRTGAVLARLSLASGSPIAQRFNVFDMPNGVAVDAEGNLIVSDIPNSDPDSDRPEDAPVVPALYRLPHGDLDALIDGRPGSADRVQRIAMPATMPNGVAVSPVDGSCWFVTCCPHCEYGGAIFRLTEEDWERGALPAPVHRGLGMLDGIGVTRRGTVLASTPLTGEIQVFTAAGGHGVLDVANATAVQMPADINIVYPPFLGGEPAVLMCDIGVGRPAGDASIAAIDISGL